MRTDELAIAYEGALHLAAILVRTCHEGRT